MTTLASRLEDSKRDSNGQALQKLERQIAEITTIVSRPEPKLPLAELEERIAARIENLTASNDDYIIEAAQHAAEEALKTFERQRKGEADEHVGLIKALAADLKNLQNSNTGGGDQTSLKETLKTIAGRLDTLNDGLTSDKTERASDDDARPVTTTKETVAIGTTGVGDQAPPSFETHFATMPANPGSKPAEPTPEAHDAASEDVMDILSRVRAGQAPEPRGPVLPVHDRPVAKAEVKKREPGKPAGVRNQRFAAPGPQGDLIAAARRAARSALANAEDMTPSIGPKSGGGGDDGDSEKGDRFSRKPVYLAAGAILLAIMAYPILTDLGKDRDTILQAVKTFETSPPALRAPAAQRPQSATASLNRQSETRQQPRPCGSLREARSSQISRRKASTSPARPQPAPFG
nr:hypothetical protein [Marinicella sp. W31]MDC2879099.1 hypothetical protein [Marinicella sp. W31]